MWIDGLTSSNAAAGDGLWRQDHVSRVLIVYIMDVRNGAHREQPNSECGIYSLFELDAHLKTIAGLVPFIFAVF